MFGGVGDSVSSFYGQEFPYTLHSVCIYSYHHNGQPNDVSIFLWPMPCESTSCVLLDWQSRSLHQVWGQVVLDVIGACGLVHWQLVPPATVWCCGVFGLVGEWKLWLCLVAKPYGSLDVCQVASGF